MNWVSVKEKLPENMQTILILDNGYIFDASYIDGLFFDPSGNVHEPQYWMDRPENPEEE